MKTGVQVNKRKQTIDSGNFRSSLLRGEARIKTHQFLDDS